MVLKFSAIIVAIYFTRYFHRTGEYIYDHICGYISTTRTCCQIVTILSEYATCHMVRVGDREFGISGYIAAGYLRPHGRSGGGNLCNLYNLLPNDGGAKTLQRIVPVCYNVR